MASLISLLPPLTPTQLAEDQRNGIVAGNITVAVLATVAVILRFVARYVQAKGFAADDYLIVAALPLGWGMAAATIVATHRGLGKHLLAILTDNPNDLILEGQAYFATEILWAAAIPLIKISILLLYVRIFGRLRYMRIMAWGLGIFTILWSIMVIIVCFLQCRPMAFIWNKGIEGTCINSWEFFVSGSSINTFTDIILLILPLPAVWSLQLNNFQRISLTGIFLLGSLTCVISLIRLVNVIQDNNNLDITWALGIVSIWSTAEPCLGIVAACLPTLRPLFSRFIKTLPTTANRSRATGPSIFSSGSPNKRYGPGSNFSHNSDFNIELNGPAQKGFRELRDDESLSATGTRVAVRGGTQPNDMKQGAIEVKTTWESWRT